MRFYSVVAFSYNTEIQFESPLNLLQFVLDCTKPRIYMYIVEQIQISKIK